MINRDLKNKLARALGFASFRATTQEVQTTDGQLELATLNALWVVELDFHFHDYMLLLSIASVSTSSWRRGVLGVTKINLHPEETRPIETMRSWVNLSIQTDQVSMSLKDMDLVTNVGQRPLDGDEFSFELEFCNPMSTVSIHVNNGIHKENKSYDRLWMAVRSALQEILEVYDDTELRDQIEECLAARYGPAYKIQED